MLLFVVAVGYLCFGPADASLRAIAAVPSAVVAACVAWEVRVHWSPDLMDRWREDYHQTIW